MRKFIKAVLITTILSVFTRALGLFIKIYISRIIGAELLGYYQIALSFFFLLCTLVTSGIPLVISRMIASKPQNQSKVVFSGLVLSSCISIIVCLFVVLFPNIISAIWGQHNSLPVLFTLLPAVIFTAIYVPFRGSFWGNKNFFLLGFTELVEQVFRFVACIILFNLSTHLTGAEIAGTTYSIACIFSSIMAIAIYFIKGGKIKPNIKFIPTLVSTSAPIAAMRIGSSIVGLLISLLFPAMLVKTGISLTDAISFFGILTGMVLPLISIPGTIISSISIALIPEVSGKNFNFISRQINMALSYSMIISFILIPVLLTLGTPIGVLLFNDTTAGELLTIGSILILPLGVCQISSSILNAIGKEKQGLITYIIGAGSMLISIILLPQVIGIYSLLAGFFLMNTTTALLNLIIINNYLTKQSIKTLFFSILYLIPSCLICYWSYKILLQFTPLFISIAIAGGLSITCMILLYQAFNFINIKDYIPDKLKLHA